MEPRVFSRAIALACFTSSFAHTATLQFAHTVTKLSHVSKSWLTEHLFHRLSTSCCGQDLMLLLLVASPTAQQQRCLDDPTYFDVWTCSACETQLATFAHSLPTAQLPTFARSFPILVTTASSACSRAVHTSLFHSTVHAPSPQGRATRAAKATRI